MTLENGTNLDYWPSRDKFKVGTRPAVVGCVDTFILERKSDSVDVDHPEKKSTSRHEQKASDDCWYAHRQIGTDLSIYVVHPERDGKTAAEDVIEALYKALDFYKREARKSA